MTEQQFQTKVLKHRRSIDYYDNLIDNEKDHDTRIALYDKFVASLLALSRLENRYKKQQLNNKKK